MVLWKPVHLRPALLFRARIDGQASSLPNNPLAAVRPSRHAAPASEGPVNQPSGDAGAGGRGAPSKPGLTSCRGERWEPRQAGEGEPLPDCPGARRLPPAPRSPGDEDASGASPVPWQLRLFRRGSRARPGARFGTLGLPGRLRGLPSCPPAWPPRRSARPSRAQRGPGFCRGRWRWQASQQDLEDKEASG